MGNFRIPCGFRIDSHLHVHVHLAHIIGRHVDNHLHIHIRSQCIGIHVIDRLGSFRQDFLGCQLFYGLGCCAFLL